MPPSYVLLQWGLNAIWCLLVFAYGAIVGSFINVLAYRLPLGLSVVSPPSRCPKCQTKLAWKDNIPVFGWIILRGKCRYCKTPISPEYPIVEAIVGALFVLFFALWYLCPTFDAVFLGIDWAKVRPVWYLNPASKTWPTFVVLLMLVSSLVAMTLVDARTFTIPQPLTTFPTIVAFLIHPIHAAVVGVLRYRTGAVTGGAPGWLWAIPTPDRLRWDWILAGIFGMVGLGISWLLVRYGLIRRSFEDYAEWEDSVLAAKSAENAAADGTQQPPAEADPAAPRSAIRARRSCH
jgi:leader peptidase (prepilin peptidase)/N-methyltransferase